ncbi:hypothetical protein Prudu_007760 [Prunus dulcis]|uniref:Uncharacterized protein n=1 Tax=Prunus dulcis TaxID=3755 RepID=A0A4Y1R2U0_PRUDU|nr:hypothetical protein Prudu_007760 [Prunus dulcis]
MWIHMLSSSFNIVNKAFCFRVPAHLTSVPKIGLVYGSYSMKELTHRRHPFSSTPSSSWHQSPPAANDTIVFFSSTPQSIDAISLYCSLLTRVNDCRRLGSVFNWRTRKSTSMAGQAAKSVAKTIGGYQYPWREKLAKHSSELSKGVWGYWHLGAWKPLGISARHRAKIRREVLLAGQDWPYDPARKEMRTKRKGHKVDRIAAEKRENTAKLMVKMPQMLLDYKKRVWEKRMKEEEKNKS